VFVVYDDVQGDVRLNDLSAFLLIRAGMTFVSVGVSQPWSTARFFTRLTANRQAASVLAISYLMAALLLSRLLLPPNRYRIRLRWRCYQSLFRVRSFL